MERKRKKNKQKGKNKRNEKKTRKGKKKGKTEKGTPQNLAPRGIFVGTLTPKTALKCDFACCRTAALQLRDCIPEVLSAVE